MDRMFKSALIEKIADIIKKGGVKTDLLLSDFLR
jgi:hypothetical protein